MREGRGEDEGGGKGEDEGGYRAERDHTCSTHLSHIQVHQTRLSVHPCCIVAENLAHCALAHISGTSNHDLTGVGGGGGGGGGELEERMH